MPHPAPPEWRAFLKAYWLRNLAEVWDNPERPGSPQELEERRMIARALQDLTPSERRAVLDFLASVLAQNLPRAELVRVFNDHSAEIYLGDSGKPHFFFVLVRDMAREGKGGGRPRPDGHR